MLEIGSVHTWDRQNDPFGSQYKILRHVEGRRYEIEQLPLSEEAETALLESWAYDEEHGFNRTPIWNKTWKECVGDERPQRIGFMSYSDMLQRDLDYYAQRAGTRMIVEIVSREEWARAF